MLLAWQSLFLVLYFIGGDEIFVAKPLFAERADIAIRLGNSVQCDDLNNWSTMKMDFANETHLYRFKFTNSSPAQLANFKIRFIGKNRNEEHTSSCISSVINPSVVENLNTYRYWTIGLGIFVGLFVLSIVICIFMYNTYRM